MSDDRQSSALDKAQAIIADSHEPVFAAVCLLIVAARTLAFLGGKDAAAETVAGIATGIRTNRFVVATAELKHLATEGNA